MIPLETLSKTMLFEIYVYFYRILIPILGQKVLKKTHKQDTKQLTILYILKSLTGLCVFYLQYEMVLSSWQNPWQYHQKQENV